jgi:hypothetical protein
MHLPAIASSPALSASLRSGRAEAVVEVVMLLGVRVTAYAVINIAEHRRRETAGMTAVINPALLDRLMNLPVGVPVIDPVVWAEMADQPPEILERGEDGASITRRLDSPLTIADVVVQAAAGRELRAVQDASLFASFTRRWVAVPRRRIPEATMLEAKLCGVGILDPSRKVLLPADKPVNLTIDGWSWLQEEKAYRRWLSGRTRIRGMESPSPATDGASVTEAS